MINSRRSAFLAQGIALSSEDLYMDHLQSRGVYDDKMHDVYYPIDPRTGLAMTDLGRVADPNLSDGEKEKILARLSRVDGSYMPQNLSDDEIMSLVPPRYFTSDQVDVQFWRDYLAREIFPGMSAKAVESVNEIVNDVDSSSVDENEVDS